MKIINLIEDTKGNTDLAYEHGLSFYIETKKHHILMDTGATDAFIENAKALGVDLTTVDTVVISHGHYDHAGGVLAFASLNPHAKIYLQDSAGADYYHQQPEGDKYIGIEKKILELPQLCLVEGNLKIDDELSLFSDIRGRKYFAKGDLALKKKIDGKLEQDTFDHEQCLVIEDHGKHILLSGCAHNGILNILERYQELYQNEPDIVISGFHMAQKAEYTKEDIENIKDTARALKQFSSLFYTGHCTGEKAYEIMKVIMGDQLRVIHSGDVIMTEK